MNQVKYDLYYIPKEAFNNPKDSLKTADLVYCKLVLSEEKNTGKIDELFQQKNYNKLLYYINTAMAGDITGYYDGMRNQPVQIFFESNNRIAKKLVFLIAFKPFNNTVKTFSLAFDDKIFNNGPIKFHYNLKDLKTI